MLHLNDKSHPRILEWSTSFAFGAQLLLYHHHHVTKAAANATEDSI